MIISTTAEAVRTTAGAGPEAAWTCLVRRGMLHSECEAVEHWLLPPGAALTATPRHGVEEALLVLEGELLITTASGEHAVRAGQLALVPHGRQARLSAAGATVRLVTIRTLAASVTDRLPPRVPELASL
ncbi:cupin domain-containing protein [Streptomyces sp. NPDC015220]|uniref:cupin domain-containing protein n=1 Tax=Streptomyces sp. NPDC015220 TaxID=3364947 RepID=UPI0036F74698